VPPGRGTSYAYAGADAAQNGWSRKDSGERFFDKIDAVDAVLGIERFFPSPFRSYSDPFTRIRRRRR
jgi:hypothetical protein